jgi:hypothetical protein
MLARRSYLPTDLSQLQRTSLCHKHHFNLPQRPSKRKLNSVMQWYFCSTNVNFWRNEIILIRITLTIYSAICALSLCTTLSLSFFWRLVRTYRETHRACPYCNNTFLLFLEHLCVLFCCPFPAVRKHGLHFSLISSGFPFFTYVLFIWSPTVIHHFIILLILWLNVNSPIKSYQNTKKSSKRGTLSSFYTPFFLSTKFIIHITIT